MREYNYDPQYKYYISSSECFKSPMDENEYLVSSSATLIPPPTVEKNQIQIFDLQNETWNIIDDLRGYYYNIFTGSSVYNENPFEKPNYHTEIKPPLDFDQDTYKWNFEYNFWERLHPIYKVQESEVEKLDIKEKFKLLGISLEDLAKLITSEIDNEAIPKIENQISDFINKPLNEKMNLLNIDIDDLRDILEIKNTIKLNDLYNLSLEEKFKLLNINIYEIKELFKIQDLYDKISNCLAELSLVNYQIQNFRTTISNSFSNIPIRYITPINVSEITILRPTEIISTSQKFKSNDDILPSGFITISVDTGERKFTDGITKWSDLPFVPSSQRYRFSRSLETWQIENPIPGEGIECYETDTGNLKIGNGFSTWDNLPYEVA
jgi:hypothetical protein